MYTYTVEHLFIRTPINQEHLSIRTPVNRGHFLSGRDWIDLHIQLLHVCIFRYIQLLLAALLEVKVQQVTISHVKMSERNKKTSYVVVLHSSKVRNYIPILCKCKY